MLRIEGGERCDEDTVSLRVTKVAYVAELAHLLCRPRRPLARCVGPLPSIHPSGHPSSFSAIAELRSHRRRLHEKSYQPTDERTNSPSARRRATSDDDSGERAVWGIMQRRRREPFLRRRSIC